MSPQPGAYGLEFEVPADLELEVGRFGIVTIPGGRLRYFGSARGPGGLRARVGRHLRRENRRDRWHVDALTRELGVSAVLQEPGGNECDLVTRHGTDQGWTIPIPGFGSSDCRRCRAHLVGRPD